MKRILIIGGCGYIGSALYRSLFADVEPVNSIFSNAVRYIQKYKIDTVDLEWYGNVINPDNINIDYKDLTAEFIQRYDVVILLAGHSSVAMAQNSHELSAFKNNVDNFLSILPKLRPGQKFIYASSASVYNGIPDDNVTEEYPLLEPRNLYDLTKQDIDHYIAKLFPDIEYYALRFATVGGYSPHLRTDTMINMMVENALANNKINILNEHLRRPLLYTEDLIDAVKKIIESSNDHRGVYNLSSFNGTVGIMGEDVSKVVNVPIVRVKEQEFSNLIGGAVPKPVDFSINSNKFVENFGNYNIGDFRSVIEQLAKNMGNILRTKRAGGKNYGV